MSDNTFRGRAAPAEPQLGSGGEPLRPQPMSAEVIAAYEAGFKAGQDAEGSAMQPHSPTPWFIEEARGEKGELLWHYIRPPYIEGEWSAVATTWAEPHEGNAAHIVRCVNSHDALVAALEGLLHVDQLDGIRFNLARNNARAAIAKAKENENAAA